MPAGAAGLIGPQGFKLLGAAQNNPALAQRMLAIAGDSADLAITYPNFASLLAHGISRKPKPFGKRAVEVLVKARGPDHPAVATAKMAGLPVRGLFVRSTPARASRMAQTIPYPAQNAGSDFHFGIGLVAGAALIWSFGGTIARFIDIADPWTIVLWRAGFASAFLLAYMLWREGFSATVALFRNMGLPGLGVACCFGTASSAFVLALQHTTVANILLIQAAAPLIAASLAFVVFRERVNLATWMAIAAVIGGIAIMVSPSVSGKLSPLGDGLALLIAVLFSVAIVITRHAPHVRMTPAVCLGTGMAAVAASLLAGGYAVSLPDLGWLFLFGAINLGFGLAVFVTGVRLIPAALAALISTLEPVLGPLWVWLVHAEVPGNRTLIGGSIVFAALLIHILTDWRRNRQT